MFPQRRRNNLSKIMRVICGFTSCVLTLVALAIVPIAPSSASTEGTAKAAENSEINSDKQPKQPKQQTESQPEQKVSNKPDSNTEKNPSATTNTNPSATNNHGSVNNQESAKPKSETSNKYNKGNKADQDKKVDQDEKVAESTKTGSNGDRSSADDNQNSAKYYNPVYSGTSSIFAGNLSGSAYNASKTPMSEKVLNDKKIKVGYLPAGTWFEIKKANTNDKGDAYDWANFEGEQCDEATECKTTKKIPDDADDDLDNYGVITFKPNRWTKDGDYKVHVVVHYPDGTTSDDSTAGNMLFNKKTAVYANVHVYRYKLQVGDLSLSINSEDNEDYRYGQSDESDLVLMAGQKVEKTTFDASAHLGIGDINQRVICYEKDKNGNPVDGKYKSGGINGLELKQDAANVKVWKHASYEQQKKCFDDPSHGCKMDELLYDDYVYEKYADSYPEYEPISVSERTVGKFVGSPTNSGNFVCKVYALKNQVNANDKQDTSIATEFDKIAKNNSNNIAKINEVLKSDSSGLFKSGITWESRTLNITVRKMSYYYQPYYKYGVSVFPGEKKVSVAPVNECGVGNCRKQLAHTRHLPDGTWFEIKQYKDDSDHKVPDWASFKGNQSNEPEDVKKDKHGRDNSKGSGKKYGKVTIRVSSWMKTGNYLVPVVAHYPDGSSSEDDESSNKGKPIYLKVAVNNSVSLIGDDDLKLRVTTKQASDSNKPDSQNDDYGDVDPDQGITMMRGMRFLNPYIDAWSLRDVGNKISLKVLCTKVSKDSKAGSGSTGESGTGGTASGNTNVWSNSVDGLTAPNSDQIHQWSHVNSFEEAKQCNDDPASCSTKHVLYKRDIKANNWDEENPFYAVERTDSIIAGAPKETGDYQCAVYALKPEALTAYTTKVTNEISVANGDTLLDGVPGLVKGKDWTKSVFPIHVVEPFRLPKTGFAGWNMLLGGFAAIATCLMVLAFALDQTQWGRAFMKNFVYQNSAQKVSEIAVQKGTEVSARKGTEIKEKK